MENAVDVPILDRDGQVEMASVCKIDEQQANTMYGYLVRGLFFAVHKQPLNSDADITVSRLFKKEIDATVDWFNGVGGAHHLSVGSGVFSCAHTSLPSNPQVSFWMFEFYDRVHFSAKTLPVDFEAKK